MDVPEIERTLLRLIGQFDGQIPAESLRDMRNLVEHNECGVAAENLCSELYEYDVTVTALDLSQIREICEAMKIKPWYWELVSRLVR